MTRHRKTLGAAIGEALTILEAPLVTLYNTEGHVSYYDEDGTTSVNVWHCPLLRKPGCTEIHSHQFHGCSTILEGTLVNEEYAPADEGPPIELVTMLPGEWRALETVRMTLSCAERAHGQGASYCIPYGTLHRARSPGLAITLFQRTEVHRTEPILMQVGGRLGTGGIAWSPGDGLSEALVALKVATRRLLAGDASARVTLEAQLATVSRLADGYLPAEG